MRLKLALALLLAGLSSLFADRLGFDEDYKKGVLYTSVTRGSVIEDIYASKEAIKALQSGQNLPENTTITMEEYANNSGQRGAINRYIIMQKQGKEWKFEAFRADKSVNLSENTQRCLSCHQGLAREDIVFTLDAMRAYKGE